jgi:hypothetical protein
MGEKILKMTNDGIYINNYDKVSYQQTNLPIKNFAFINEVFWKVSIKTIKHNGEKALQVEVLDYNIKNSFALEKQSLVSKVPFMIFLPFEYEKLNKQVACQKSGLMRSLCKDHPLGSNKPIHLNIKPPDSDSFYTTEKQLEREKKLNEWLHQPDQSIKPYQLPPESTKPNELPLESKEISIKQRFSDSAIKDGYIEFKKQLPKINEGITISIFNDFLKQEYDLLKEYIAKRIGKKTFTANVIIHFKGDQIESVDATSDDIAKINETFIEEVRIKQINLLKQAGSSVTGKNLFAIDEVFKTLEQIPGNVFNNNIDDIIKVLTDGYKHRNSEQILFLSNQHNADLEKVRLTLRPLFGFLFYIDSENNHNYIWELLDSHATYIWSFSKAQYLQAQAYTNTESFIQEVHEKGRNIFKHNYLQNKMNYRCRFIALDHEMRTNSNIVDFEKWKEGLLAAIFA